MAPACPAVKAHLNRTFLDLNPNLHTPSLNPRGALGRPAPAAGHAVQLRPLAEGRAALAHGLHGQVGGASGDSKPQKLRLYSWYGIKKLTVLCRPQ